MVPFPLFLERKVTGKERFHRNWKEKTFLGGSTPLTNKFGTKTCYRCDSPSHLATACLRARNGRPPAAPGNSKVQCVAFGPEDRETPMARIEESREHLNADVLSRLFNSLGVE